VLNWGDVSVLSLHATKLFHSVEGGALIIKDDDLYEKARKMINFGIAGPDRITEVGINAKMSEFHAAMGHCMLDDFEVVKAERQRQVEFYRQQLEGICKFQKWNHHSEQHCAYMPVMFRSEKQLLKVFGDLQARDIYPKRYFYPSLDAIECFDVEQVVPLSRRISQRIACLPLYHELSIEQQQKIVSFII
jgi:dTDP-4-amino-4,6-dideoxygalactose transaminase